MAFSMSLDNMEWLYIFYFLRIEFFFYIYIFYFISLIRIMILNEYKKLKTKYNQG